MAPEDHIHYNSGMSADHCYFDGIVLVIQYELSSDQYVFWEVADVFRHTHYLCLSNVP